MQKITAGDGLCQAYGVCGQIAPGFFRHDDDGYVVVIKEEFSDADRDAVEEATLSCPVGALLMEDR